MKIKKGDIVKILTGTSKGKTGKVLNVFLQNGTVTVEGVNLHKKHTRPRKQGQQGQVVEFPAPLPSSKVALVCPKCGKTTRVGYVMKAGEKKRRVCKKCRTIID
ncbi:50S ribosomal protein L24 [Candidatus Uhrbacteria bacterium]|nr:50S ribosomal protein L24 [Candidatus Uhrbacteria bacterium]